MWGPAPGLRGSPAFRSASAVMLVAGGARDRSLGLLAHLRQDLGDRENCVDEAGRLTRERKELVQAPLTRGSQHCVAQRLHLTRYFVEPLVPLVDEGRSEDARR